MPDDYLNIRILLRLSINDRIGENSFYSIGLFWFFANPCAFREITGMMRLLPYMRRLRCRLIKRIRRQAPKYCL
jgi:hypothetical protein